ncbi:MAG: DNA repair protein RadA [Hyphomicrobiales bacterium]|nr:DNA repair protein RadA [Hyphomicrobiales bacterium]
MAKTATAYVCQECGATTSKWSGKCGSCGAWNAIAEEAPEQRIPGAAGGSGSIFTLETLDATTSETPRQSTALGEFDRVLGGGLVPGSAILVGGDPGIGKSTLLLQAAAKLATAGGTAVYLSGEESSAQVRLRAQRLGVAGARVGLATETSLPSILRTLGNSEPPDLVIIDSIQTLWSDLLESAPGTVSQVRACAQALVRYAKRSGATVILVGHITKEGQIAGPKVVEHMVDTVLYFEGDGAHRFRILRAVKNRYGATDEIGVFEMRSDGLAEVANPSELFLGDRNSESPGAAVFAGMEGTRPVLVEIQALVAPSPLGTPRRAVVGWDSNRLAMLLAVLDARCGLRLGTHDVYLNVAGGLRISEPAADLATAAALVSSFSGIELPAGSIYFGEVSLSGAIRPVGQMAARLREAEKLGFTAATIPDRLDQDTKKTSLALSRVGHLEELTSKLISAGTKSQQG